MPTVGERAQGMRATSAQEREHDTNTWVNRFENWEIAQGLPLPLLEIRHEDLNETLQLFYSTLVKAAI